ncbi:hypothetical protein PLICRDRAFT_53178 [Plicaturopsis crispa FD-325 SS-3]|nr:hypothetical protein PLICRDRAFT_53178 [Plicaturopsis crispa FD-325 SS-3]
MHDALSLSASPELYAQIYQLKFDLSATFRRTHDSRASLTPPCLANELVKRCQLLRRIRLKDWGSDTVAADLWTAYLMIMESDGLNESQLIAARFPRFISEFALRHLRSNCYQRRTSDIDSLAVWLYWFTLSRDMLQNEAKERQDEILALLRPFAVATSNCQPVETPRPAQTVKGYFDLHSACVSTQTPSLKHYTVSHYSRNFTLSPPDLSAASIIVYFAVKGARKLQIPGHVPPNRSIANATRRRGPTMEDWKALTRCRDPLVMDGPLSRPQPTVVQDPLRSTMHDQDFYRIAQGSRAPGGSGVPPEPYVYIPGTLTGTWEGSLMVSPPIPSSPPYQRWQTGSTQILPDFLCRRSVQFTLREHLCFSPCIPLPDGCMGYGYDDDDSSLTWSLDGYRTQETDSGIEFSRAGSSSKFCYETYCPPLQPTLQRRDPRQALDVVITGETESEHELAWGGFNYAGRVRMRDGFISLKREPKHPKDDGLGLGSWCFEGYLHAGRVFAGRWRQSKAVERNGVEGIFSLHKRESGH